MQQKEKVKDNFENASGIYDDMIRRIIPYYEDQHKILIEFLPFRKDDSIKVLDLGVGTGGLSQLFLETYPNAQVKGIDLAKGMLGKAKERLGAFDNRFTVECADFYKWSSEEKFDLIAAGLSLHHLTNEEKQNYFRNLPNLLTDRGVFLLQDLVTSEDMPTNLAFLDKWMSFMDRNEIDSQNVLTNHREHDLPTTVENQLNWLKEAGFPQVFCPWRYLNFAILVAKK